jgi:hypothetical protein
VRFQKRRFGSPSRAASFFVALASATAYVRRMRQLIAKLLLLCAVLLMPFGMAPVPAAPAHSAMAGLAMRHCPEQGSKHQSKGAFAECTMACASALPAADRVQERPMPYAAPLVTAVSVHVLHGLHPDTATPPPKSA